MTDKQLREAISKYQGAIHLYGKDEYESDVASENLDKALADWPGVARLLQWAYQELESAGGGGEECAFLRLIELLEKDVQLTETGWEWTE